MDKKYIYALTAALVFQQQVQAQTMPVINPAALTIKAVVRQLLIDSGMSATSAGMVTAQAHFARYLAASTTRIAAGTVAIAKSPTMLAIGGTLIVGSILYTTLGNKGISINMNADGTTTTYRPVSTTDPTAPAFNAGDLLLGGNVPGFYPNLSSLISATISYNPRYSSVTDCVDNGSKIKCTVVYDGQTQYNQDFGNYTPAPIGCPANNWIKYEGGGVFKCYQLEAPPPNPNDPPTSQPTNQTLDTVSVGLKPEEKAQPVAPAAIANMVNAIGQQLQQDPNYNGPPLPPATEATVSNGLKNAGLVNPTVGDFVQPVEPTNVSYDPVTAPTTGTGTNTGTTPTYDPATPAPTAPTTDTTTIVKPDLGTDPGIGSPGLSLEPTPSESQMLAPVMGLLPDIKNITFEENAATCPFNEPFKLPYYNNKEFSFNIICDFFAKYGALFKTISLIGFTLISARIVLSA